MSDTGVGETRQTKLSALGTNVMPETIGVQAEGQDRTGQFDGRVNTLRARRGIRGLELKTMEMVASLFFLRNNDQRGAETTTVADGYASRASHLNNRKSSQTNNV